MAVMFAVDGFERCAKVWVFEGDYALSDRAC